MSLVDESAPGVTLGIPENDPVAVRDARGIIIFTVPKAVSDRPIVLPLSDASPFHPVLVPQTNEITVPMSVDGSPAVGESEEAARQSVSPLSTEDHDRHIGRAREIQ